MTTKLFGEPILRKEDDRLLTGQGKYLDDLGKGSYSVAFLRSPHAAAKILSIDATQALEVPGLVALYTYEDLDGNLAEPLPLLIPHPNLTAPKTGFPLAKDCVKHVGEAIAMVVATDRYIAEDIVDLINVEYEIQEPVVGISKSKSGVVKVHEELSSNVSANLVQEVGDARSAIRSAPHKLELDLFVERSACMPLEGKGVLAIWDSDSAELRLWSSTQTSTGVRAAVAAKLGLPLQKVECTAPDVGGGFGVKIMHPWPEEILIPWAAIRLNHPIKWTEDRREHFISSSHERSQEHHVEVGFDENGRILGLDVTFFHDNGAYTPYGIIIPIITSTQLLGPYKPKNYRVDATSLYTNTVLVTPYRGAGRPQGVYVMERTMDAIAKYLGISRTEVREVNFIQPEEMPYDQGLIFQDGRPLIYDSGNYPESLKMLKEKIGWDEFEEMRAEYASHGRTIGIGIACYVEGTGVGPYEGGFVQVETSGRVNVSTGLTSQGQGHQTAFAQIVADELGVDLADVFVTTGDTRRFAYAVGTFASRAAVMSGNAVALAARNVRAKALKIAAEALECDPRDLTITKGFIHVKGTQAHGIELKTISVLSNPLRYAFDESAKAATQFAVGDNSKPPVPEDDEPGLEGKDYYSPMQSTFASGMHGVIVETFPDTAEIKILKYVVIHDCGNLINPLIVEGQIHGGVAQGVAGALYERMAYGDDGQLMNASFMDFLMPYATEIPNIETGHLETPSPLNPLGIKGAGEAGVIPSAALFASAIEDAEGFPIHRMPISPSELFDLRRLKKEKA